MYSVEPNPSELAYPSVIHLSLDSFVGHAPPLIRGRGFIRNNTIPCGCVRTRGGGHKDDAPCGFRNEYLPFDG